MLNLDVVRWLYLILAHWNEQCYRVG